MRKTKIVCTIGPKTCHFDALEKLAEGGMNVARLNMSHGTHDWHRQVVRHVRTLNEKRGYSIALMLDTKGPEVRSGDLKHEINLKKGDEFIFTVRREAEYAKNCTEVSYDGFIDDVKTGDVILVDGGMLSFAVRKIVKKDVFCECLDDGTLGSRRHLNVRGRSAKLPSITEKDWADIDFGIAEGVDFIALSFVKTVAAVRELKRYLAKKKAAVEVISKIESAASIPRLDAIIEASDGVMVARGDLGSELPIEEVPLLQERIVRKCRDLGLPVIVATHLLESMIVYPTPTRAEVTDITAAVEAGADAIMLSGETAAGNHPFKALAVMDIVARRIEQHLSQHKKIVVDAAHESKEQIVLSAAIIGNNMEADALIVITRRGYMAGRLARTRCNPPIFAFTNTPHVRRKLNLYWGTTSFRIEFSADPEKTIQRAIALLKSRKLLRRGQQIVLVSDILAGDELVETVQVRKIK